MGECSNDFILHTLSEREKEVLRLIGEGFNTKMIANQLSVSFETIKSHRNNIMAKLNESNIAEALYVAMKYSLLA